MRLAKCLALLDECVKSRAIRDGKRVHAHMIKAHCLQPIYLQTKLIIFYVKCDLLCNARHLFDQMHDRTVVSWTAMISGYTQKGLSSEGLNLFLLMLRSDAEPNEFTLSTILSSCTGVTGLALGRQIHGLVIRRNYKSNLFVGSALLDMYAKAGRINEARGIFEDLPERDVVSCTAIISGYAQQGWDEEAVELFRKLLLEGMASNYVTYASLLTALSGLAALDLGKQVHNHVLRMELLSNVVLTNALVDMYAKCGNLNYARKVFESTSERTIVSWNAMLVGYCKHGMARDMLELFDMMRSENKIQPDSVTILAVLSGCSHGKLENKGLQIFDEMLNGKFNVQPKVEHYGCVVDLLGRAGQLKRALQFTKQMPFLPTAAIWGSLLGACRMHGNIEIGEIVGHHLLEIEPENAGNYVILSNMYASAGRWEDVRNLRAMMQEKAVVKEPGRSWIEIGQTLHTFHANDRSHPRREEIMAKVQWLSTEFKKIGYMPDLSCVLYDVDKEQKEKIVLGHSEKLALAFGLIALSDGAPIRVIKNLRICADCHEFAKCLSKLYGLEVSLRDKSRYHHIIGGLCSCGDYW